MFYRQFNTLDLEFGGIGLTLDLTFKRCIRSVNHSSVYNFK